MVFALARGNRVQHRRPFSAVALLSSVTIEAGRGV